MYRNENNSHDFYAYTDNYNANYRNKAYNDIELEQYNPNKLRALNDINPNITASSHHDFERFVHTVAHKQIEDEATYRYGGLRNSTSLNDDTYDFALIVKNKTLKNHQHISSMIHIDKTQSIVEDINQGIVPDVSNNETSALKETMIRLKRASLICEIDEHTVNGLYLIKVKANSELLENFAQRNKLRMQLRNTGEYTIYDPAIREEFVGSTDPSCPFPSSTRQRLLDQIIKSSTDIGGAGLDHKWEYIVDRFPLHMYATLESFRGWIKYWEIKSSKGWKAYFDYECLISLPLDQMRSYFGERIAFFYAFIRYYIIWLTIPTFLGVALGITQVYVSSLDSQLVPFFCIFLALWATVFLEYWKRKQASLAHHWGVLEYETYQENARPEYNANYPKWKKYLYTIYHFHYY